MAAADLEGGCYGVGAEANAADEDASMPELSGKCEGGGAV